MPKWQKSAKYCNTKKSVFVLKRLVAFPCLKQRNSYLQIRRRTAVVVAQLVEWSLPTPEVRDSKPIIGKIYMFNIYSQLYRKDENKRKRGREWPIFKNTTLNDFSKENCFWGVQMKAIKCLA